MKQFRFFTIFAAALLSAPLWAQGPWTSGDCTVTLADGVLTVSGNGAMENINSGNEWNASAIKSTITSIVVEEGVTSIGNNAFYGCSNVTSVSLPSTLTTINLYAFQNCSKLESITIPASVNRIRQKNFTGCSKLQLVRFLPTTPPDMSDSYGHQTFDNCHSSLRLEYPDGSDDAYASDPVICPNWWNRLYNAATGEHAPSPTASGNNGTAEYTWSLFANGQLNISGAIGLNVNMPSYSGNKAPWRYYKDHITEVVVNEGVHTISQYAFYQHSRIRTVYIMGNITAIEAYAFKECPSIAEVYCKANPSGLTWNSDRSSSFMTPARSKQTKFYVPAAYLSTYKANWDRGENTDANVTFGVALYDNSASTVTEIASLESSGVYVLAFKITRTLYKDGAFNTLCLPFALASLTGTPLEGAEVFEFVSAEKVDAALHINIRPVDAVEAGKPYLIRWASGENITSMVFSNVQVTAHEGSEVKPEGDVAFIGTLDVTDLPENENYLFVGANNTLYYSDGTADMKAFRAYFRVDAAGGGGSMAPARFNILPKLPTGTDDVRTGSIQVEKVMENGVLYIIKNGVRYNAQGRIVE